MPSGERKRREEDGILSKKWFPNNDENIQQWNSWIMQGDYRPLNLEMYEAETKHNMSMKILMTYYRIFMSTGKQN